MSSISLRNVVKIYDGTVVAVSDFSLEIADQEFIVLVGPSGCGKSTVLRIIAGLEQASEGEVYIGEQLMNNVPPRNRDIAMVFQNYALYPHMTAYKNMAFGLENRKMPKEEIKVKVLEAAKTLAIGDLLKRKPKAMSGGERQRVALGRAIVRDPAVFLLDEPLSNLDAKLRTSMRTEIIKLHKRLGTTFVYVTHDQIEAMTMGSRIVVMKDGFIHQVGTPDEVYHAPANLFVASFIGTPPMNFLSATIARDADGIYLDMDIAHIRIGHEDSCLDDYLGREIIMGIRPDHITIGDSGIPAQVEVTEALGSETHVYLQCHGERIIAKQQGISPVKMDDLVSLYFNPDYIHIFDKVSEVNIRCAKK
jgi:multiple sugar transport system ATP-binding protein